MGEGKRRRKRKMEDNPVATAWGKYHRFAVPVDCSPAQFNETRRAFICGASLAFKMMVGISGMDEEEGIEAMSKIAAEVVRFEQEIGKRVRKI